MACFNAGAAFSNPLTPSPYALKYWFRVMPSLPAMDDWRFLNALRERCARRVCESTRLSQIPPPDPFMPFEDPCDEAFVGDGAPYAGASGFILKLDFDEYVAVPDTDAVARRQVEQGAAHDSVPPFSKAAISPLSFNSTHPSSRYIIGESCGSCHCCSSHPF